MNEGLIELKGVTKKFGKNTVLDSIDLQIPEGKITGIIGASGEGKSTILKMIASFYKPTAGKIFYMDKDILKDTRSVRNSFGFAIEDGSFYENLTVEENLRHFGKLYHVKKKVLFPRVEGLMHFVGLVDAKNVLAKNLSLGMKKRLDIACSLVHNPKVLILDEPTADLDPLLRFQIIKLIKKINSHGKTIVFTTQLLEEADEICDKIAILYNEKITDAGTSSKIKEKYKTKSLNDVFRKLFSKKGRKAYQESKEKKTELKKTEEDSKKDSKAEFWYENEGEKISREELEEVLGRKGIFKRVKNKILRKKSKEKK